MSTILARPYARTMTNYPPARHARGVFAIYFSIAITIAAILVYGSALVLPAKPLYLDTPVVEVTTTVPALPALQPPTPPLTPSQVPGMEITKLGQIVSRDPNIRWRAAFSGMGCILPLTEGGYRVWLTGRNVNGGFAIGHVDLNSKLQIVSRSPIPTLPRDSEYDAWGMFNPCVVRVSAKELRMYYPASPTNKYVTQGRPCLAISNDEGKSWAPYEKNPLMVADGKGLQTAIGTHWVFPVSDGWRMVYTSVREDGKKYTLRWADSPDGFNWTRPADNIAYDSGPDQASPACPCVWNHHGRWLMAYCMGDKIKQKHYRVRMAESQDEGQHWTDLGQLIDVSASGWDSEMTCYPRIAPFGDDLLVLYTGNNFGVGGLGAAILKETKR